MLIFILYNFQIILNAIYFLSYLQLFIEFKNNEFFLNSCKEKLIILKKFEKISNPKISIISAVYNSERYILRFLKSIQNQNFRDIEILLINDCSKDNSINIIEKYIKIDKRIILIKNKNNKGTFITRNIGVLYSKGKYLVFPDPDDIISKNIFNACFKFSEKNNYDIIKFNEYIGNKKIIFNEIYNKLGNKAIYKPKLSTYIYYGNIELEIIDIALSNKFIKKVVFIKALNLIKTFYLNEYIIFSEDSMMNYIIFRIAESFLYIKKIGYYYIKNKLSITNSLFNKSIKRVKMNFKFLKLVLKYTKNNKYEKDMAFHLLTIISKKYNLANSLSNLKSDFKFYYDILNKYLNSKFLTIENRLILNIFKNFLKKNYSNILLKK